mmetsp:Transcript_3112/g.11931  ORF Transcript_3112/g.11931 Transcript_3112/m.11931 type:complete len:91 (+) Transcript_3112:1213-1485(+)
MSHLQQETQLSKQQIHRQLDILRDGNLESVTTQKKEIIEIWLLANKLRRPTQEEREILRQKVNLNRQQLSNQLTIIKRKLLKAQTKQSNE